MICLPVGVEPFQETLVQGTDNKRGVKLMEDHVKLMANRLEEDIDLSLPYKSPSGGLETHQKRMQCVYLRASS